MLAAWQTKGAASRSHFLSALDNDSFFVLQRQPSRASKSAKKATALKRFVRHSFQLMVIFSSLLWEGRKREKREEKGKQGQIEGDYGQCKDKRGEGV